MGEKEKETKLHEILAVEPDAEGEFKKIAGETQNTFSNKAERFMGGIVSLKMHDESRRHEEEGAGKTQEVVETVPSKLEYSKKSAVRYFDILLQKESTNQKAKADLIVDGVVLAEGLPATFLLALENRLKLIRSYLEVIPTHQPGIKWVEAPDMGKYMYKSDEPVLRQKTEKSFRFKVLYDATKEHPAQIEKWSENIVVGTFTNHSWTGTVSPAQKSVYLERIDKLIRATKKARQRANGEIVEKREIGNVLFNYLLKI